MTLLLEYTYPYRHTLHGEGVVQVKMFSEKQDLPIKSARGFVIIEDKFVLAHGVPLNNWQLPGGSTEENETEYDTFKREVQEETSIIELNDVRILCYRVNTVTFANGATKIDQDCILVGYAYNLPEFQGDIAGGTDGTRLVTKDELKELLKWGESLEVMLNLL